MIYDELRNLQNKHGYLPGEEMRRLAQRIDVPLYRIQNIASYYPHFHLKPPPAIVIGVCADMSCHLRGAGLASAIRKRTQALGSKIAVKEVSCLGQCDRAPAISVNDHVFPHATGERASELTAAALAGEELASMNYWDEEQSPSYFSAVSENPAAGFASDPYTDGRRYGVVRDLLNTQDWDGVLRTLKTAGLVGMGGAGFPTATKWNTVRKAPGSEKYVVCNADESEPGTTKDRCILELLPHLVIEGMLICGLVTGAKTGFLYIRHEYERQQRILEAEIENCRSLGLLSNNILGTGLSFELELFVSPGGYICGESSALLEAIEGNRAEPRIRPPNTAKQGLWQKPTALKNVETFAAVSQILARGVNWYKTSGGLKFVSVSGDVCTPGVFEIRTGTPASEVILNFAGGPPEGKKVKAFAPSGASSGFVPPSFLEVPLDFQSMAAAGTMLGSGAIVVCAEGRCMLDMALNTVRFFRNESCGKCVPCRLGSQKLFELLTGWTRGQGRAEDVQTVEALSDTLRQTSICGLGQILPQPILSVLKYFRAEIYAHIFERQCPERVCPMEA
jgi:NADH:ubiquinone oxidoreductase subunit F (NADH-binding)/NADH:ubiquinone oxidoreductase subunit E